MKADHNVTRVFAGYDLAAHYRARLDGVVTQLLCGQSVRQCVLQLDTIALDLTRDVGLLVEATEEQLAEWVPDECQVAYQARLARLNIPTEKPGEASEPNDAKGGS